MGEPLPHPPTEVDARQRTLIARRARWSFGLRPLWEQRELLWFLTARDIKVRYKQTVFGVAWAVVQPALAMIVYTIVIGRFAGLAETTGTVPYPLYAFAALLPWQLVARALGEASTSLLTNRNLITKVYFPRVAIPLAPVTAGMVDLGCAFLALLALMSAYGVSPTPAILALPAAVGLSYVVATGIGLWLSALVAVMRDVRHMLPLLTQLLLFASPVAYPLAIVPERWREVYAMNPVVGAVELFRWSIFGGVAPAPLPLAISATVAVLALASGLLLFHRLEPQFADTV